MCAPPEKELHSCPNEWRAPVSSLSRCPLHQVQSTFIIQDYLIEVILSVVNREDLGRPQKYLAQKGDDGLPMSAQSRL